MYRITPNWNGALPFDANGAHILVLVINAKPTVKARGGGQFGLQWYELGTNGRARITSRTYHTRAAATTAQTQMMVGWQPFTWEVSVDDFLNNTSNDVARVCMLYASLDVTFQPRADALHLLLAGILGVVPTSAQVKWTAWYLGVWVTDGMASSAWISQGGAPPPDPHHHRQVMQRLMHYQALFGEQVRRVNDQVSDCWSSGVLLQVWRRGWRFSESVHRSSPAAGVRSHQQQAHPPGVDLRHTGGPSAHRSRYLGR